MTRIETTDTVAATGGNDLITLGDGDMVLLGGVGADSITAGDGDHVVIGDNGLAIFSATGLPVEVSTTDPALGGDDTIALGSGRDIVLAGVGADLVSIGSGGGAVIGDNGRVELDGAGRFVRMETRDPAQGGDDTLTGGDGASFVFGGTGADVITTAGGDDVISGDMAVLTFVNGVRSVLLSVIGDPAYGGDDSVGSGAGDDWIILGEGNDYAESDSGLNIVSGDAGRIEALRDTGIFMRVESTQPAVGGDDTIMGGVDRDIQIGGAGADYLDGSAGNDLMQGDNGLLRREGEWNTGEWTFESTYIRTGGDDTLIGGEGRDVMIGGIGNDLFSLFVGDDIVAGEFLRLRFILRPDGTELITSFLTPAVRDLDVLVQITAGVNLHWGRTVVDPLPSLGMPGDGAMEVDLGKLLGDRYDVLFLDDALYGAAILEGLISMVDAAAGAPELSGFRLSSSEVLVLETAPAAQPGTDEGEGESPRDGAGVETDDTAILELALRKMAGTLVAGNGAETGSQMKGWRMGRTDTWRIV
jgi:Ca2+-binding RTX toxin-like protein